MEMGSILFHWRKGHSQWRLQGKTTQVLIAERCKWLNTWEYEGDIKMENEEAFKNVLLL